MPKSISKTAKESSLDKKLQSLLDDRTSGAALIESNAIKLFEEIIEFYRERSAGQLQKAIKRIKDRFSAMANMSNLAFIVEGKLRSDGLENLMDSIRQYKIEIEENRRETVFRAAKRVKAYGSIFTLSGSSMILEAILEAANNGWKGKLNILESRPKNEGTELAKKTARAGIKTVLGVDTNLPEFIMNSGAVFLGADAVTETYFVNKIGSDMAIEYAAKLNKPVYIAADKSKFISEKIYKFKPDRNPSNEIASRRIENLEVVNNYFEKIIPRGKVHFICGKQALSPEKIKNLLYRRI